MLRSADRSTFVTWVHAFLLLTFFGVSAPVQAQSGSVRGVMRDGSGGALPGVTVSLVPASGTEMTAVSGADGTYAFSNIAAGTYTLRAMLPGFSPFEQAGIVVGAQPVVVDAALELAALTDTVTVDAQMDRFKVLPTRPTNSLFGFDKSIAEIPRSISVIESDHITRYDVRTVNDLVTVAPGSFTGSYFGVPGSLFVRGEPGDNFFRGFRRVENRGNYATPVAATDHIEIVKGPPSPIYGGGKIGGFLNFLPKTARSASAKWMERPLGKFTATYGAYEQRLLSGEVGVPFSVNGRRAGLYAFAQYENSNSYYDGIFSKSNLGQVAVDMELSATWRLEFGGQVYAAKRPQNIGWNRVTQALVDRKEYLSGTPLVNLSSNGTPSARRTGGMPPARKRCATPPFAAAANGLGGNSAEPDRFRTVGSPHTEPFVSKSSIAATPAIG